MTTKTVKNTDTETKATKTTAKATAEKTGTKSTAKATKTTEKPKAEKPKATAKKKTEKEVQTSELPKQEQVVEQSTAVAVPEQEKDIYSAEFVKQATAEVNKITIEIGKVEQSFLNIAFSIFWLHDNVGYKPLGYDNIYDLAKDRFCISRGTCCNYINIVQRFGEKDELGNYTGKLAEKYEPYSSSKLVLMLDLTDEEIEQLSPTLSVREMKKKIKVLLDDTENKEEKVTTGRGGFSQSFDEDEAENFTITRQALISCMGKEDYQNKVDTIDDLILKALKAHPEARIEIVLVTAQSEEEKAEEQENTEAVESEQV